MESETLEKLPYYQRLIRSHHHDLEGIFIGFIDYRTKKIEYSELLPWSNISMIWPPDEINEIKNNVYEIVDNSTLKITLNINESRYFDLITLITKDINKPIKSTYTLNIKNVSDKTINKIMKINISSSKHDYKELIPLNGGRPIIQDHYETTIIFKYIDPVIRLCCEYTIIMDEYFRGEGRSRLEEYRLAGTNDIDTAKVKRLIDIIGDETKEPSIEIMRQKSVCGKIRGKSDCCSITLNNINLSKLSIKHELFNLDPYHQLCSHVKYDNYPFKSLQELGMPEAHHLLIDQNDHNILLVKILQMTINTIIEQEGRAEGQAITGQRITYPNIHLLEVLDSRNNTWILRSERIHLALSPCVHNGLGNLKKVDHFLNYLNLWDSVEKLEFAAVSWLHAIGHTLDLLYCGKEEIYNDLCDNTCAFKQVLSYFKIFMGIMPIQILCKCIPNNPDNPHFVELFYYICINDFSAIKRKLIRPSGIKDGVDDNFLLLLKQTTESELDFAAGNDRTLLINDIIEKIKSNNFSKNLDSFPFYNYLFSFRMHPPEDKGNERTFAIKPECYRIKQTNYGCRKDINYKHWSRFNSNNYDETGDYTSLNLILQNYN